MDSVILPLLIISVFSGSSAHPLSSQNAGDESRFQIFEKAYVSSHVREKRSTGKQSKFFVDLTTQIQPNECFPPTLSFLVNGNVVYSNSTGGADEQNRIAVQVTIADTYFPMPTPKPITYASRYFLSEQQLSYYYAQQDCHNRNMELVSIADEAKRIEVYSAMSGKGRNYLTSAQKKYSTWYWAGDVPITYFYEHTSVRAPTSQDCIEVCQACGGMIDRSCQTPGFYMCEQVPPKPVVVLPPAVKFYLNGNLVFQNSTGYDPVLEFYIHTDGTYSSGVSSAYTLVNVSAGNQQKSISATQLEDSSGIDITVNINENAFCPEPTTTTTTTIATTTDIPEPKPKTFLFSRKKGTYESAIEFCKNQSMQIIRIQTNEKNLELQKYIMEKDKNNYYWTSGYKSKNDKAWYWDANTKVTYSKWVPGEPNNKGGNENCIELLRSNYEAKWNDQECDDQNYIVCESFD